MQYYANTVSHGLTEADTNTDLIERRQSYKTDGRYINFDSLIYSVVSLKHFAVVMRYGIIILHVI